MLIEGVKIYPNDKIELEQQIELNNGLMYANANEYTPKALIPSIPWRSPSSDEYKKLLCRDASKPPHSTIGLIDLPSSCFDRLKESGFYDLKTIEDFDLFKERFDCTDLTSPIMNYLSQNFKTSESASIPPLGTKLPGLPTVSSDLVDGKEIWVGLHVDRWDRKSINQLNEARNRICVNLGKEPRFFIFLNLTIAKICRMLEEKVNISVEDLFLNHSLLQEFIKHYPKYPLVKIHVYPNQAYIAPTENIFHDGSTLGMSSLDIQMTLRGHFRISKKQRG